MKKILPIFVVALSLALVWVVFFWQPQKQEHSTSHAASNQLVGGDFLLQSAKGGIELKNFRGKVMLIYFGYTWCPDVCPTNLAMMAGALGQLTEQEKDKVQGLFISVDPERDNVNRLAEYTAFFHPSIIGATSDAQAVKELASRYGSVYQKVQQDSATGYVVDHSSETYVVDPEGKLVERLPHGAPPEEILNSIRKYM